MKSILSQLLPLFFLQLLHPSAEYMDGEFDLNKFKFIGWGGKCKIPVAGELLHPSEACDQSKGIICQKYQQGNYCGCAIDSTFLSYDAKSGECRRRPGEHCVYINTTANPRTYERLPFQLKCHQDAECVRRIIAVEGALAKREVKEVHQCVCRRGYFTSRDGFQCQSVNRSTASGATWTLASSLLFLLSLQGMVLNS